MFTSGIAGIITRTTTFFGMTEAVQGIHEVGDGNICSGIKQAFLGMTLSNISCNFIDSSKSKYIMKASLLGGALGIGVSGVKSCVKGFQNLEIFETVKGIGQTILGFGSATYINGIDPEFIEVLHNTACLTLSSSYVAYDGMKDLSNQRYSNGAIKIILGTGGIASSGLYLYNRYHTIFNDMFWAINYLESHENEVESLYNMGNILPTDIGEWKYLSSGFLKHVFTHPRIPGYVIKVPHDHFFRDNTDNRFRNQFSNVQRLQKIIQDSLYSHLIIPESQFIETSHGPLLVEKMYHFEDFIKSNHPDKYQALKILDIFIKENNLCDIDLFWNLNAKIMANSDNDLKVVLYDVDCTNDGPNTNS